MKKRLICAVLSIILILPMMAVVLSAHSAESANYLALGDSIATGYALANYIAGKSEILGCYPTLISKIFDRTNSNYTNLAVDGLTSAELLARLDETDSKNAVESADLITISIGSNDLLGPFIGIVKSGLGIDADSDITVLSILAAATQLDTDEKLEAVIDNIVAALTGNETLTANCTAFKTTLASIIAKVKTLNPNAEIYVSNIYNPYKGFTFTIPKSFFTSLSADKNIDLDALAEPYIQKINEAFIAASTDYKTIDVYSLMKNSEADYINASSALLSLNFDPHPNAAGHAAIAQLFDNAIFFDGGDGTAKNPYLISTKQQLINMSYLINKTETHGTYYDKYYKLTANIDLGGGEWSPIAEFSGSFDGNGKTVSGLKITGTGVNDTGYGLFGKLGSGAVVTKLTLDKPNIKVSPAAVQEGAYDYYVGAVAGYLGTDSTVSYCTVIGGSVEGYCNVGGIAGYMQGSSMQYCGNNGTAVTGTSLIGGLAGNCESIITLNSSYNTGKVNAGTNVYHCAVGFSDNNNITNTVYVSIEGDSASIYGTPMTKTQFESGAAAYYLNSGIGEPSTTPVWGQTIGTDKVPVYLAADKSNEVLRIKFFGICDENGNVICAYGNKNGAIELPTSTLGTFVFYDSSSKTITLSKFAENMNVGALLTPVTPLASSATSTDGTITVTPASEYHRYACVPDGEKISGSTLWIASGEFTGLNPGRTYKIYTYIVEGNSENGLTAESAISAPLSVVTGKRQLEVGSLGINSKQYDGTTDVNFASDPQYYKLIGLADGDKVTLNKTAAYDTPDAGTDKTITFKFTISGEDADKYIAPKDIVKNNMTITQRPINNVTFAMPKVVKGTSGEVEVQNILLNSTDILEGDKPVYMSCTVTFPSCDIVGVHTDGVITSGSIVLSNNNYSQNIGSAVIYTVIERKITGIEIVKQPDKLDYFYGDTLDPDGLEVLLTCEGGVGTKVAVKYADFAEYGLTLKLKSEILADGGEDIAALLDYDGCPFVVCTDGSVIGQEYLSAETDSLSVAILPALITVEADKTSITGGGTVKLTITLVDYRGNPLLLPAITEDSIAIRTTSGYVSADPVDEGNGIYIAEVTLPNKTQKVTITVGFVDGIDFLDAPDDSITISAKACGGEFSVPIVLPTFRMLSFNTNGGDALAGVMMPAGSLVTLTGYVPTREGFTFAGWYSDAALTNRVTSVILDFGMTIYAKWQ